MVMGMRTQRGLRIWRMARAGGAELNPANYTSRATAFSSAAGQLGDVTLLVHRTEAGITGHLVTADQTGTEPAAMHLAQAVAARAEEVTELPDLSTAHTIGWLAYRPGSAVNRETQQGVDPSEAARRLAVAMAPGQWVAVSLRQPTQGEKRRHRRWLVARMATANPTHHSVTTGAVVMAVRAGGGSPAEVSSLLAQVASAMPGFDVDTVTRTAHPIRAVAAWTAAGVAAWFGLGAGLGLGHIATIAGSGLTGVGLLLALGAVPSPGARLVAQVAAGRMRAPLKRAVPPRRPRKRKNENGEVTQTEGDYPLAKDGFMVAPNVVVGLVAPGAGALSGASSTTERPTPPTMRTPIGPLVGTGTDRAPAFLSAEDAWSGTFLVGKAGSGKSQLVRSLFGWNSMERVAPSGQPGFPGKANTLVAFESKGDGAQVYTQWAQATGDRTLLIDVADPTGPALDLFAVPGTVAERAQFFTNAMVYAFTDGAIGDRSFATLVQVFTAALAITPEIASQVQDVDPNGSPMYFAHLLLAGHGDAIGASLAGAVMSEAVRLEGAKTPDESLSLARTALMPLFSGSTAAGRRTFLEAPSSKVSQLLALDHWWSPARPKTTWAQVVTEHRSVVINTGVTVTGRIVDDRLSGQMSSLLMFGLRDAIMRSCNGWSAQGRSVSIFADELSLLAGSSPEVVTWLRNQGRSYGVRPTLATQYPEQLNDQVRMAVTGFSTIVAFAQDNVRVAEELARDFAADGTPWLGADVVNLPPFTTIVRSSVGQQRQSAFTMSVTNFEADMAGFVAAQRAAANGQL
jgi:hypothetical protein